MSWGADIAAYSAIWVDKCLSEVGDTITVYKFTTGTANRYGQRAATFSTGVACVGHCVLKPSEELIALVGNEQKVDAVISFSRLEMKRKFASGVEGAWVTEKDEFDFEGKRYRILKVLPSGRVEDYDHVFLVFGANLEGAYGG